MKVTVELTTKKEITEFFTKQFCSPLEATVETTDAPTQKKRGRKSNAQKAAEAAAAKEVEEPTSGGVPPAGSQDQGGDSTPPEPPPEATVTNNGLTIEDVRSAVLKKAKDIGGEEVMKIVVNQTGVKAVDDIPPSMYFKVVEALK